MRDCAGVSPFSPPNPSLQRFEPRRYPIVELCLHRMRGVMCAKANLGVARGAQQQLEKRVSE